MDPVRELLGDDLVGDGCVGQRQQQVVVSGEVLDQLVVDWSEKATQRSEDDGCCHDHRDRSTRLQLSRPHQLLSLQHVVVDSTQIRSGDLERLLVRVVQQVVASDARSI